MYYGQLENSQYRGVSLANGHKFMMGNDEIYPLILKASVSFFFQ